MSEQLQSDRERHSLEIIEQQKAEIANLRHQLVLWEIHSERMTAVMELVRDKLLQIAERSRQHQRKGRGHQPRRSRWNIGLN